MQVQEYVDFIDICLFAVAVAPWPPVEIRPLARGRPHPHLLLGGAVDACRAPLRMDESASRLYHSSTTCY